MRFSMYPMGFQVKEKILKMRKARDLENNGSDRKAMLSNLGGASASRRRKGPVQRIAKDGDPQTVGSLRNGVIMILDIVKHQNIFNL